MKRAFTRIELLVVIAILAAILFPVFAQAKLAAKSAALSNTKQLGTLIQIYVADHDDTTVPIAGNFDVIAATLDLSTESFHARSRELPLALLWLLATSS